MIRVLLEEELRDMPGQFFQVSEYIGGIPTLRRDILDYDQNIGLRRNAIASLAFQGLDPEPWLPRAVLF